MNSRLAVHLERQRSTLLALLVALCVARCGSDSDPSTDAGPKPAVAAGYYLVDEVDSAAGCADVAWLPGAGDFVHLESRTDQATAAFGTVVLVQPAVGAAFVGCEVRDGDQDGVAEQYQRIELTLTPLAAGYQAALSLDQLTDGKVHPCTQASFALRPLAACEPTGRYRATASTLLTGACDLSWAPAEVVVSSEGGSHSIEWSGTAFDDASLSPEACALTVTRGVSRGGSFDLWTYNGASRSVELSLQIDGMLGTATIQDALDGPTTQGEVCPGATFEVPVERVTGIEAEAVAQPTECALPRPPVCGDGTCEASETCRSCPEDCGCTGSALCVGSVAPSCRVPCSDVTIAGECGAGQRCGLISEPSLVIDPAEPAYCVETASLSVGSSCLALSDCADGLICLRSTDAVSNRIGVCSQPCGPGTCPTGYACEQTSDGSATGTYPSLPRGCSRTCSPLDPTGCPEPDLVCSANGQSPPTCVGAATSPDGVGVYCSSAPCEPGLACIRSTTGSTSEERCRLPCDADGDCVSTGGTCRSIGGKFGACL